MKTVSTIILLICISMLSFGEKPVRTGEDVIVLMKEKYAESFVRNLTFSQYVFEYQNGSVVNKTVWHEAYRSPNQLIIKFDSFDSGDGYVFRNDSIYIINNNQVQNKIEDIHDLMVLGFDVYVQPVKLTIDKLTKKGYDISRLYETSLNGKSVYCVGASDDNDDSPRFYVDKERLVFIKMINNNHGRYDEAIFDNYRMINGKYIATEVVFFKNGNPIMKEEYFDIAFPQKLKAKIFDPNYFKGASW
ncbi:hypothetical protein [Draconibacterium sediminis]|nr:hypothetical protein [Draconibacterium sediminis]